MSVPDSLITDPGDVDEVQGKVCEVCGNLDSLRLLSKSAEELSEGDVKHDKYGSSSRRNLGDFDLSGKDGCSICSVLSKVCHFFIYENSDLQRKRVRVYLPGGRGFPEMSIDDFGVAKTIQLYTPIALAGIASQFSRNYYLIGNHQLLLTSFGPVYNHVSIITNLAGRPRRDFRLACSTLESITVVEYV
ncbi:hypothetical protein AB5N19_09671 [Seiridium cardinale]